MNASEQTYHDVERLLDRMSWSATKRWGGDFEEWRSTANEAYCCAYASWDSSKGANFSTYLWWCVRNAHINQLDASKKWHSRNAEATNDLDKNTHPDPKGIERIMQCLGDDARTVVSLFINSPAELSDLISARNPIKSRKAVWKFLRDSGWTMGRAIGCFDEIREALV